jgi:hypothetical protein
MFSMKPADYLVVASVSFIVLLEATATEAFVPAWMNLIVSAVACVVAWLLALDGREQNMGKEK